MISSPDIGSPRRVWLVLSIALGAMSVVGRTARAEQPRDTPAAIEVDRDAAPAGRVGLGFDGGEPVEAWGVSAVTRWIDRPIRLGEGAFGAGAPASDPVRRRETLALGGALAVGDSVVVDLGLRASHQVGDRLRAAGASDGLARFVFQDLRLGGRIRVAGDRERAALLRVDVTLPTGNSDQFAGDARWTAAWALIGRATLPHDVAFAVNAGIRLHGAEVAVGDRLIGDELFAAAGIAVPLPAAGPLGPVALTGALLGALGDHVGPLAGPSPLEARLGAILRPLPALAIGAQLGVGLDDAIGAPRLRVELALAWTPPAPRASGPATAPTPTPGTAPAPAPRAPGDDDDDDGDGDGDEAPPAAVTVPDRAQVSAARGE